MCERFYLTATPAEIKKAFKVDAVPELAPRYNIAPTQLSPIMIVQGMSRALHMARWGLVPSWSRDLSIGTRMVNAPAETIDDKPGFREPFQAQRCLVPVSGFYEWQSNGEAKQPYKIAVRGRGPFALAGLWERWESDDAGSFYSFTIITTSANKLMREVHDRMPVVIAPADYQRWLTAPAAAAKRLLVPYTAGMSIVPISSRVNSPKNDDRAVLEPVSAR